MIAARTVLRLQIGKAAPRFWPEQGAEEEEQPVVTGLQRSPSGLRWRTSLVSGVFQPVSLDAGKVSAPPTGAPTTLIFIHFSPVCPLH